MVITVTMPALSPTMTEGVIARWLKKEGDRVTAGEVLCEINTDKSTVEYTSIEEGYLRKIVVREGASALVNQGIAIMTETANEDITNYKLEEPNLKKMVVKGETTMQVEEKEEVKPVGKGSAMNVMTFEAVAPRKGYKFPEKDQYSGAIASPLAKRLAKEQGLDLTSVRGTGPGGRIVAKDLEAAQKEGLISYGEGVPQLVPGTYELEELTQIRKVIAERLQASKMSIPHYYITEEVYVDRLIDLRNQLKEMGMKVTYNDFILRATALALRRHPVINSGYDSKNNKIIRFKTIDISLAVSIPDGLITPIIPHADYKDLNQLSQEAKDLAKRAKENKLSPEEYQGGSFTVSNLGMFGIHSFQGVINPPQAAILSVGGIKEKAVVENGMVKGGNVLYLTGSFDHRVIDGADGAQFLHTCKKYLENPASLIV